MVSLWNTRPGGERPESPPTQNDDDEATPCIVVEQPDEHTRLLPQPSTRDGREGFLSPDDPAVSIAIQPLERVVHAILLYFITVYHLPLVGTPPRQYLRESARLALSRLRLLRLILYESIPWKPDRRPPILL
ncbi:hypothetical protein V500_05152 [Pseudogymnoascus sp. VKM F-4518 (FW-2643)]|nr:hypothetical protein V500_05152 [Pseudogymnoascus sp. VKM F-4518 (FW-2643)]